jgi:predicted Zn-dependent peptidase
VIAAAVALLAVAELPKVPEAEAWRKAMPAAGAPRKPELPKLEVRKLENGLTVLVASVRTVPVVSFRLVTKGGSALDPIPGGAGLASLTYGMLEEGAGDLDALAFSDRVADLGAGFRVGADRDRGEAAIGGLVRNAEPMMALLADAVLRPRFAEEDFERLKEQTIASLLQRNSSPQSLAFEVWPSILYGASHPLGHPPSGTLETVPKIDLAAVKAHHARTFGPATSALIAAGDISVEDAVALARTHFGAWDTKVEPFAPMPAVEAQKRTKVVVIDKAGPQSIVIVGRPLFGRGHPDEVPLQLINEVYGGAFSSRINMNLREAKGITYGAGSQVAFRSGVGAFVAYAGIQTDSTAIGAGEFLAELDRLKSARPPPEEIERARSGIMRSLPGHFETAGAIGGAAVDVFVYDLPLDHFDRLLAATEGASLAAIQKAGDDHLASDVMQILIVGNAGAITDALKLLRFEIEVRQPPQR